VKNSSSILIGNILLVELVSSFEFIACLFTKKEKP